MAGYDRSEWKSNNALFAEEMGMRTASSLAKVLKKDVQAYEVETTFEAAAWHHTSGRYNVTNYFWEPVVEMLAKTPSISDEDLRSKLRDEVRAVLSMATDHRDVQTFEELRDILEDDDAFARHVEKKRQLLQTIYAKAKQRAAADKTVETVIANVSYKEFSYSHRQSRYKLVDEVCLNGISVTIKGDWATFMVGNRQVRKKISGSTFQIEIVREAAAATN